MKHTIVANVQLAPNVHCVTIHAQRISNIRQPGQFVIVRAGTGGERIPLTIADADADQGTITLVIQAVGKSTRDLAALQAGDTISTVVGPLGHPTELVTGGNVVCVGGGVGTAVVHPIAQGLHTLGVPVTSIIGGRSKELVIFEEELQKYGKVIVCTDDGSYGQPGFVTDALTRVIDRFTIQ